MLLAEVAVERSFIGVSSSVNVEIVTLAEHPSTVAADVLFFHPATHHYNMPYNYFSNNTASLTLQIRE